MKAALIILPIIIICAVVGAGMAGVIEIPGLSPAKKKAVAKKDEKKPTAKKKAEPAPPLEPAQKPKPKVEEIKMDYPTGDKKLAKLWNEMDTSTLGKIVEKWKDPELASVLQKMDPSLVAILLADMKPERASKLSREIRRQAAVVQIGNGK